MTKIQTNPLLYYWIEDRCLYWYYAWARQHVAPANDNSVAL